MEKYQDKLNIIKKVDEALEIKDIKIIEDGVHSLAIFINNNFVFRFPLKKEFFIEYVNEEKILKLINPYIYSTEIPKIEIYNIEDQLFSRHKMIGGDTYLKLNEQLNYIDKKHISKNLAEFLYELHSIKTNRILTNQFSLDEYDIKKNLNILYDYLKYPKRISEFNNVMTEFENESQSLKENNIVICHNDLNENNFLINEANKKLSGVIDFGNNIKRDYSSEFATLLKYDFEFVMNIIDEYEKLTKRKVNLKYSTLLQKIRCYGGILWSIIDNELNKIPRYEKWLTNLDKIKDF